MYHLIDSIRTGMIMMLLYNLAYCWW